MQKYSDPHGEEEGQSPRDGCSKTAVGPPVKPRLADTTCGKAVGSGLEGAQSREQGSFAWIPGLPGATGRLVDESWR